MTKTPRFSPKLLFIILIGCLLISCELPEEKKSDDLPVVQITADSIVWDQKLPGSFVFDALGNEYDSTPATFKFRGGMSSRFDKHSFSVKLKEKRSFGQESSSKNWILNASYIDRSFMRHKLSFDLYRQMAKENKSPRCRYVWVKENKKDLGIYLMMERMDKHRLELNDEHATAFISKDPPLFFEDKVSFHDSLYTQSFEFPKKKKKKAIKNSGLKTLENLIYRADDATFKKEIFQLLDINSVIDWQLMILFTNNGDGQLKNCYLYRQQNGAKMKVALWDYDHTFGRDGDSEPNLLIRKVDERRNPMLRRIIDLNAGGFNEKIARRWKAVRKEIFTRKNIFRMISENHKQLKHSISKNAKIWPTNAKWYYDHYNYYQDLALIKKYVKLRLAQLDQRFHVKNH